MVTLDEAREHVSTLDNEGEPKTNFGQWADAIATIDVPARRVRLGILSDFNALDAVVAARGLADQWPEGQLAFFV